MKILVFVNQKFSFIPKEIILNSLVNLYTKLGSNSKRKWMFWKHKLLSEMIQRVLNNLFYQRQFQQANWVELGTGLNNSAVLQGSSDKSSSKATVLMKYI